MTKMTKKRDWLFSRDTGYQLVREPRRERTGW
jgi:hypothetical protein